MAVVLSTISEPSIVLTGTLTFGSAVVTALPSVVGLIAGQVVTAPGLVPDTLIASVDSPTQVTLTELAQATGATSLTVRVEPVTLAQAKKQIRLEIDVDDAQVARTIGSARRFCELFAKRSFLATTFEASWDSFPFGGGYYNRNLRQFYGAFPGGMGATFPGFLPTNTGILEMPRPDLLSVTSVTYLDANNTLQTMDPSAYVVQPGVPGRLSPAYGTIWPISLAQIGAVTVRFVAGRATPADVPEDWKAGILIMISHLYENRGETSVEMPRAVRDMLSSANWGGYA